jgi:arylsulfatase A-like enzyme
MKHILALTLCLFPMRGTLCAAEPRPNILWIVAEDFSPNLGCYGDPDARTPNLDRLAAQGVRFNRAFSHAPVCAAARSTLITGMSPASLGSQQMRTIVPKPDSIRTFPELLRKAGYFTFNGLKMGSENHDYRGQSKDDFNFRTPVETWEKRWDTLPELAETVKQRPFFGIFGSVTTHQSQYGRERGPLNALHLIPLVKGNEVHDRATIHLPPYYPDEPELREIWARYHDHAMNLDRQVGELVRRLEQHGLLDDTIIFFFGDHGHGVPGGKRCLWDAGLHVPLIVRVPEKFRHLIPEAPGTASDRMVSFEDFAPSMLRLAGIGVPEWMQGRPFLGAQPLPARKRVYGIRDRIDGLYDLSRSVRDDRFLYIRNFYPHHGWIPSFTEWDWAPGIFAGLKRAHDEGKMKNWRQDIFFTDARPVEELYDVNADLYQLTNLAGDPRYAADLERLRGELFDHMWDIRDVGLLPEFEVWRRAAGKPHYDVARETERMNPIGALWEAAAVAAERDPKNIGKLTDLLKSGNAGVRWWAAQGLAGLRAEAKPAGEALANALKDDSPEVRIAAAEALCHLGKDKLGLPVLLDALKHETIFVRMQAINAFIQLGDLAKPHMEKIVAAKMDKKIAQIPEYHLTGLINHLLVRFGQKPLAVKGE